MSESAVMPSLNTKKDLKGYLFIALGGIIWGSNGVIANLVPLPATVIVFFRVLIGGTTLLAIIALTRRFELLNFRSWWKPLLVLGLLLASTWVFLFQALQLIPIGNAVLLNYLAPVFVALFAPVLLKERITKSTIGALTISMIGIILVTLSQGLTLAGLNIIGIITGLLAAITYASFVVLTKRALYGIPSETLAVYTYLVASMVLSPFAITTSLFIPLTAWVLLIILGVVNTAIAVTIYFYGLKQIKAQEAAILTYIEPASAVVYGMIFLGQLPSLFTLIGGILIVIAGVLVTVEGGTNSL